MKRPPPHPRDLSSVSLCQFAQVLPLRAREEEAKEKEEGRHVQEQGGPAIIASYRGEKLRRLNKSIPCIRVFDIRQMSLLGGHLPSRQLI